MSATVIYVQEGVDGWGDGDVVEIGDCAERSGLKPNRIKQNRSHTRESRKLVMSQ